MSTFRRKLLGMNGKILHTKFTLIWEGQRMGTSLMSMGFGIDIGSTYLNYYYTKNSGSTSYHAKVLYAPTKDIIFQLTMTRKKDGKILFDEKITLPKGYPSCIEFIYRNTIVGSESTSLYSVNRYTYSGNSAAIPPAPAFDYNWCNVGVLDGLESGDLLECDLKFYNINDEIIIMNYENWEDSAGKGSGTDYICKCLYSIEKTDEKITNKMTIVT